MVDNSIQNYDNGVRENIYESVDNVFMKEDQMMITRNCFGWHSFMARDSKLEVLGMKKH